MNNDDWSIERWRVILVLFLAFLGGILTGFWLISLVFALLGYIGWLLYKLSQLHTWLIKGAKPSLLPDSNGLWERITQQIQLTHKKSDRRKERMANVLKRLQGIILDYLMRLLYSMKIMRLIGQMRTLMNIYIST